MSAWASICSTVSKLCGFSSWPGTLMTLRPLRIRVSAPASSAKLSMRLRREAGPQAVADEARQPQQRITLARRAQEKLVGDPLVVEGKNVAGRREKLEQRDGVVVALTRRQAGQRRLPRDQLSSIASRKVAKMPTR